MKPQGILLDSEHPADILSRLHPGGRFSSANFASYHANPAFPSQEAAAQRLQAFIKELGMIAPPWSRLWRKPTSARGLYLDGGFGVGKTHLLVSTYAGVVPHYPASYIHFQELTSLIGQLGMVKATQIFSHLKLLCIDEFELDDPGNMHLVGTFLAGIMAAGVNVVTTSNTPPEALGQGRFNAAIFHDSLNALASRFEAIPLDGSDYRKREHPRQTLLSEAEYKAWLEVHEQTQLLKWTAEELDELLLRVHPADFGKMLCDTGGIAVTNLRTFTHPNKMLREQGAIRFVHFADKVYDLGLPAAFTGVPISDLFEESYRAAAFGRKYSRCLSRVAELTREAARVAQP